MEKKKKGNGIKKTILSEFKDFEITIPLLAQILFTEAVFIFAIVSLFEASFLPVFYIVVGITLLIMAYNNYTYYKKKYFNTACAVLSAIYAILAVYFIVSTIFKLFTKKKGYCSFPHFLQNLESSSISLPQYLQNKSSWSTCV